MLSVGHESPRATPGSSGSSGSSGTSSTSTPYSSRTVANIVAFGDSFTANSHRLIIKYPALGGSYPKQSGCLVAPDAWPGLFTKQTGRPVQNGACNTHTTSNMPSGSPAPRTVSNERATRSYQKAAAVTVGVRVIDLCSKPIDCHSSCAEDAARHISGNWDITTADST